MPHSPEARARAAGMPQRESAVPRRAVVYALLFAMTAISYLDRAKLSVAAGPLADELGLSPVQLGWLFSGFLWTYIVFLVPAGRLVDRFGYRWIRAGAVARLRVGTRRWGQRPQTRIGLAPTSDVGDRTKTNGGPGGPAPWRLPRFKDWGRALAFLQAGHAATA